MNANALSTNTGTADNHGKASRIQGLCVAPLLGPGPRPIRDVYGNLPRADLGHAVKSWAGRGNGVRGPVSDETPLSESEVAVLLREGL